MTTLASPTAMRLRGHDATWERTQRVSRLLPGNFLASGHPELTSGIESQLVSGHPFKSEPLAIHFAFPCLCWPNAILALQDRILVQKAQCERALEHSPWIIYPVAGAITRRTLAAERHSLCAPLRAHWGTAEE